MIDPTVAILYAQTNLTSRAAHEAAVGPQSALAMSRAIASEMSKQEQKQVQSPEPGVEARIAGDGDSQSGRGHAGAGGRRKGHDDESLEEENVPQKSKHIGNLLNVKV